jgi:hypothetical protein
VFFGWKDVNDDRENDRVLVRLLVDPTLLRFWQKRAATNLSWLRIGRVSAAYAEMLT